MQRLAAAVMALVALVVGGTLGHAIALQLAAPSVAQLRKSFRCPSGTHQAGAIEPSRRASCLIDGGQVQHGPEVSISQHGRAAYQGQYTRGTQTGVWSYWSEQGHLFRQLTFAEDGTERHLVTFHDSGQRESEGDYAGHVNVPTKRGYHEVRIGTWRRWYPNQTLREEATYRDDKPEGHWTSYWPDGTRQLEGTYAAGLRVGPWRRYWENGKERSVGAFEHGREDGEWRYFDEAGQLEAVVLWQGGKLQREQEVQSGKLLPHQPLPEARRQELAEAQCRAAAGTCARAGKRFYRRACALGDGLACASLADDPKTDPAERATLRALACIARNAAACEALEPGLRGRQLASAAIPLKASCDAGGAIDCRLLGDWYYQGETVARDIPRGRKLLARAQSLFAQECPKTPGSCYQAIDLASWLNLPSIEDQKGRLLPLGCAAGDGYSCLALGRADRGRGLQRACDLGIDIGCFEWGFLERDDSHDRYQQMVRFRRACELGFAAGCSYAKTVMGERPR